MVTKTPQNSPRIFYCKKCDYQCSHLGDYNKHLITRKHTNDNNGNKMVTKLPKTPQNSPDFEKFNCVCGKYYKHRSGLSRHKKTCTFIISFDEHNSTNIIVAQETDTTLKELVYKLLDENNGLTNKIVDMAKQPTNVITNNQTNNFNVLNYLNNECKEAMNLSDFIAQLQISFDDLLIIKDKGFVPSIEHSFINKLKNMEQALRPIHCTDKKRKSVYVKDENKWTRDSNHKKINKAITDVNNKQYKTLNDWFKKNPTWNHDNHTEDSCLAIMNNIYGIGDDDIGEKNKSKILNKIVDSTLLQKDIRQN